MPTRKSAKKSPPSRVKSRARKSASSKSALARVVAKGAANGVSFPNESAAYRAARQRLLAAEVKLRRNVEDVAALRRKLPVGGEVAEDYVFREVGTGRSVRMSELFGASDTLILYSYMYGPQMAQPCTSCTSILDGLNGSSPHINDRVPFYAVAKSSADRIADMATSRGWNRLRMLSSANNSYNRDYKGENDKGGQMPSLNVFVRRNGKIHHFYHTELLFGPKEPGMDHRHVDMVWPVWNMFDFTPEGRGQTWYPKLQYS